MWLVSQVEDGRAGRGELGFMRPLVDLRGHGWDCSQTPMTSQSRGHSQSEGGLQCSPGLHQGPSFRRPHALGGGPETLALILGSVGCPQVLPSLHPLQMVPVHFPLGEDEEDTTGEAHAQATPTAFMGFLPLFLGM